MEAAVTKQHAHPNTVFHCLYGYYNLGFSKQELAEVYNKTDKTIGNWIKVYERTGTFERARTKSDKKFDASHRQWLIDFYQARPLAYIDEAQSAFKRAHHMDISKTSVWRIIHDGGLTWKVLERRAMHTKELDILRFMQELSTMDWSHQNLVFLDERKPRVSVLAFIGVHGIIDYYDTEGTFDRVKFLESCRLFAYSKRGNVRQYPGSNSVWILDGAAIHRDPEIVHFLRSIGVVPIFLPAYCPFFNPIEYLFGYVKKAFQRHYEAASGRDLTLFIAQTFTLFEGYEMANVFEHCGWSVQGYFNPVDKLAKEINTSLAHLRNNIRHYTSI
ncbi:hypothetical protein PHYSODRAFT_493567 [Phytophthora sojae]|uniref:Tc1-like transposase DDE domain-containing protein n=1 Tax=Phytophthora sojae (strain P6497) TaxID=1094619 RepID=G4ZBL7_PHYSP|nr:hypothetical protein PHYSODRAFT_493567 [Phytophthora sojae]EGZ20631.1 hypothetical protein PHYSODRAFT_493567 [Phytophthora sojae]|eukprot:XP_009523348.1 hypothetical protein PHYSODRAFT_493567 [Phytophthora sojae]